MKLKIDNQSYVRLCSGLRVSASALNDIVSTSRGARAALRARGASQTNKDLVHAYESRYSLVSAFLAASKSKRISVVANFAITNPIRCKVTSLGEVDKDGLLFGLELSPIAEGGRK